MSDVKFHCRTVVVAKAAQSFSANVKGCSSQQRRKHRLQTRASAGWLIYFSKLGFIVVFGEKAGINAVYIHVSLGVCVQATAACPGCSQCRKGPVPS